MAQLSPNIIQENLGARKELIIDQDCLFCKFLQSESNKIYDDDEVYMFKDIAPKAEHHFLIIPKKHMRDASHIRSFDDLQLIEHMMAVAETYVNQNCDAENKEVKMLFHKPIFTMIKHLHMHVLVGPLTFMGKIHFSSCITTEPHLYTKKYF